MVHTYIPSYLPMYTYVRLCGLVGPRLGIYVCPASVHMCVYVSQMEGHGGQGGVKRCEIGLVFGRGGVI